MDWLKQIALSNSVSVPLKSGELLAQGGVTNIVSMDKGLTSKSAWLKAA
jgi:hypothetical protein